MKLSEAIRLGAMLKPQAFYVFFDGVATCAWGSVANACGRLDESRGIIVCGIGAEAVHWRDANHMVTPPCNCPNLSPDLFDFIGHLNDFHHWTRERIADWVEEQESKMEANQEAGKTIEETVTA